MKIIILALSLFLGMHSFAQKDCNFTSNINDSIGSYKETKDYLMHEKVFAGKSAYLFFSLINNDGTPILKVQQIVKSADFIQANCFNGQSKIFLQLQNGKVITLLYGDRDTCGKLVRLEEQNLSTRILSANFLFMKGSLEDLKKSPVSLIRIRYATENTDIVIQKEFTSELMNESFHPESYFMDYLACVTD